MQNPTFKKMNWKNITSISDVENIVNDSFSKTCMIFKHSTRCEISAIAKYRLESDWANLEQPTEPFLLDLIDHRDVSNFISEKFSVFHESPQVLLLKNGECFFDTSHLDISVDELNEVFEKI